MDWVPTGPGPLTDLRETDLGAASLKTPSSDSFTIPGVQAQQASDLLTQKFPALSANGAQGLVVFEAPKAGPVTSAPSRAAVESSLDALRKLPGVTSVTDPYQTGKVAPNGSLALATVSYQAQPSQITTVQQDALTAASAPARDAGMTVVITGASSGAGKEATRRVAAAGGAVIMARRRMLPREARSVLGSELNGACPNVLF